MTAKTQPMSQQAFLAALRTAWCKLIGRKIWATVIHEKQLGEGSWFVSCSHCGNGMITHHNLAALTASSSGSQLPVSYKVRKCKSCGAKFQAFIIKSF